MNYFFVLGNNPALSAAEIAAVVKSEGQMKIASGNVLLWEGPATDAKKFISRLGGTIKVGIIVAEVNRHDLPRQGFSKAGNQKIREAVLKIIENDLAEKKVDNKYCFGFSYYGQSGLPTLPLGLEIKKLLKEKFISCRLVTSREKSLSSVVVEQNKLVGRGIEIILVEDGGILHLGKTLAVQPFKDLSHRDFGRPGRDDQSGMLPPKLAQIMLNLSGKIPNHCLCAADNAPEQCPVIFDPFCGSGTILTEAALMGAENLIGSDISEKAILDTKDNFSWLKDNYPSVVFNADLFKVSVEEISKKILAASIDAIVTEPYLGPQRGRVDFSKIKMELEKLYSNAIKEFAKILKPDGTVVMVWPVFTGRGAHNWDFLNPDINGFKISNPLPQELREVLRTTARQTIIYGREGQKIFREIVVLKFDNNF
jgi:tRNA G10  N-methylase Trm11